MRSLPCETDLLVDGQFRGERVELVSFFPSLKMVLGSRDAAPRTTHKKGVCSRNRNLLVIENGIGRTMLSTSDMRWKLPTNRMSKLY